jgi:hypothetical protein
MAELLAPIRSIFEYVDMMPSSIAFRESIYVSPYTTVAHVVAMAFFAGLILMMDLRLMGVANMSTPFSQVQRRLFPLQMLAMGAAAATGLVLAFGDPLRFYSNIFFWTKMTMMALAGLNAMAFHYLTYDSVPQWDSAARPPAAARLSGTISVFLWSCIILLGRLIPYNWFA